MVNCAIVAEAKDVTAYYMFLCRNVSMRCQSRSFSMALTTRHLLMCYSSLLVLVTFLSFGLTWIEKFKIVIRFLSVLCGMNYSMHRCCCCCCCYYYYYERVLL